MAKKSNKESRKEVKKDALMSPIGSIKKNLSDVSAKSGSPKVKKNSSFVAEQMSPVPSNESSKKKKPMANSPFAQNSPVQLTPKENNETPKKRKQSQDGSTSKKKSKKLKLEKEAAPVEEESPDVVEEKTEELWSQEQTTEFLECIKNMEKLTATDAYTYKKGMKMIDFSLVCEGLNPPRSVEACQEKLALIIKSTNVYRSLREIVNGYKHKSSRVSTAFDRWYKDNKEEISRLHAGKQQLIGARAMYKELSDEEKQKYIDDAQHERSSLNLKFVTKKPVTFYGLMKHEIGDIKETRTKFESLSEKKKLKYIRLAWDCYEACMEKYESALKTNKDVKVPKDNINKNEYMILLKVGEKMPMLSSSSAYALYRSENTLPEGENSLAAYGNFKKSVHYTTYKNRHEKILTEFKKSYSEWSENNQELHPILISKAEGFYKDSIAAAGKSMAEKKPKPEKVASVKTPVKKTVIKEMLHTLEDAMVDAPMRVQFTHEPVPGALTPYTCYVHFARKKGMAPDSAQWAQVAPNHKIVLKNVAADNIKNYKEAIKDYCASLSEEQRKQYVGQNRKKFIRQFEGTDIFEREYPISTYPPFRSPPPKVKAKKSAKEDAVANLSIDDVMSQIEKEYTPGSPMAFSTPAVPQAEKKQGSDEEESDPSVMEDSDDSGHEESGSEPDQDVSSNSELSVERSKKACIRVNKSPKGKAAKAVANHSDSDSSEDSEQVLPKKIHAINSVSKNGKVASKKSPVKKSKSKSIAVVSPKKKVSSSKRKDSSSSESSSDDDLPTTVKHEDSSSDSSDTDAVVKAKMNQSQPDSSSEDDSDMDLY